MIPGDRKGSLSVVLPVRGGWPHGPEAVSSILQQSWLDFEVVLVDDGLDPRFREHLDGASDPRLKVVPNEGSGLVNALNTGLQLATGKYTARHDADDVSAPGRFAAQVGFLDTHPDVDVTATTTDFIDGEGREVDSAWTRAVRAQHDVALTHEQIRQLLPLTCCLAHGSIMARTHVLATARYDPLHADAEDYDLWLRLCGAHRFAKLPGRLYRYRVHDERLSTRQEEARRLGSVRAKLRWLRLTYPGLPVPAQVLLQGGGIGRRLYEHLGGEFGLDIATHLERPPSIASHLEALEQHALIVVTDFERLAEWRGAIDHVHPGMWVWEGNFAVSRRFVDSVGAADQPVRPHR